MKRSCILCLACAFLATPKTASSYDHRSPIQQAPEEAAGRPNPYDGLQDAQKQDTQKAGAKLFDRECASCHGHNAEGGHRAPSLVSSRVQHAPPGALFWVLRNGSLGHGMPSFSHLPEPQRWQIVTYLKSLSIQTAR